MIFHTFYSTKIPDKIVQQHKSCCDKIGVSVQYHSVEHQNFLRVYQQHGEMMNWLLNNDNDDVVCFLDLDCLPHNLELIEEIYEWVKDNQSFCGNAQNISHTSMRNHIYAAPSLLMVSKSSWKQLGEPSMTSVFENGLTSMDTSQLLTLRADQVGFPYRLMYPIGYDKTPEYNLSGYGKYGIGTLYPTSWHHFSFSEYLDNLQLWEERVNNILNEEKIISKYSSVYYGL